MPLLVILIFNCVGATEANIEDEIEELNVSEFRSLIQNFIGEPVAFINSSHSTIKKFVDWINYGTHAEEILKEFNILKRYNNEYGPGIWIQPNSIQFTPSHFADWKNFRYVNRSGPSDKAKFLKDHKYVLNYWDGKNDDVTKLRKFYHPEKSLAVIIQFDEPPQTRPVKKRKSKRINQINSVRELPLGINLILLS